jgi:hypothetical protein
MEELCPDVDTHADNHFSCLDQGYYKYSCSHHHSYQSDILGEKWHFLRESILTISVWASSLEIFKKSHQRLHFFSPSTNCLCFKYLSEQSSNSPFLAPPLWNVKTPAYKTSPKAALPLVMEVLAQPWCMKDTLLAGHAKGGKTTKNQTIRATQNIPPLPGKADWFRGLPWPQQCELPL